MLIYITPILKSKNREFLGSLSLISPLARIYTHHCRRHGATVDGGRGCANGSFDPDFRAPEGPIFLARKYERRDPHFPF
ncbi:hypothetical protein ES332_A03G043200v1 [Gossypium tomentosum]|uniref:Uncharacterized protein n=1 Tax=Gossypium tomentosum TaxID=34277 RepID=A0A5D2R610_GOSTO|nr:hypothetical protein ES332_A03G043200v1 [Gossypium tomentosum]